MSVTKPARIRLVDYKPRPTLQIKMLNLDGITVLASIAEMTCFFEYVTSTSDNISEYFDGYLAPWSFDHVEEIFDSVFAMEQLQETPAWAVLVHLECFARFRYRIMASLWRFLWWRWRDRWFHGPRRFLLTDDLFGLRKHGSVFVCWC